MDHFYERHVLHSLAIAKFMEFKPGASVMDIGTGGGFPAIPLAIMFPHVHFTAVDSIGKKIKVLEAVSTALELSNLKAINARAETIKNRFDFIVSRATAPLNDLSQWGMKNIDDQPGNGIIALKGGDLEQELKGFRKAEVYEVSAYFNEPFFETKKIVFLPR